MSEESGPTFHFGGEETTETTTTTTTTTDASTTQSNLPYKPLDITAEERKARFERLNNNSVTVPAPTPSYPHDNTGNAVHSYYTNSVNHVKDPFSSIQGGGGGGGGGEDEGEEDEGDGDELEGEDEEFGESDN